MPTWVPDWQLDTKTFSTFRINRFNDQRALIGNNLFSQLISFLPGGELCVKGFEVDVVSEVFGGFFPFWPAPEGSNPIIELQIFAKYVLRGPSVKTETLLSAFFRLLIYNKLKDSKEPDPQGDRFFRWAAQFLKYIFQKVATGNCFVPGSLMANTIDFWPWMLVIASLGEEAAQSEKERLVDLILQKELDLGFYSAKADFMLIGCLLFRTESGYLGMGPVEMETGDTLCRLAAHPEPFLLRPAGPRFTNVGDCDVLDLDLPEVVKELIPNMRNFEIE